MSDLCTSESVYTLIYNEITFTYIEHCIHSLDKYLRVKKKKKKTTTV